MISPRFGNLERDAGGLHARAGQVIDRLRSLLKRRSLDLQPIDLRAVINEVLSMIHIDATARRVKLTEQRCIQVHTHRLDHGTVEVRVSDNGPGFAATSIEQLSEPF